MSNQATANLSVGIKTEKARQDLLDLKRWLQTEMRSIMVSIDPASIDRSIAGYLKQRTFRISVNTRALSEEIQNDVGLALDRAMAKRRDLAWDQDALRGGIKAALEGSFAQRRRVNFDAETLRGEITAVMAAAFAAEHKVHIDAVHLRAQVQAALGGVNLPLGAAAGPGATTAALGPSIALAIRQALTPAVDELGKAAAVIGGGAHRVGAGESGGKFDQVASQSLSATMADGRRIAVRQRLEDVKGAALAIEGEREQQDIMRLQAESSRETFRARRAARRYDDRRLNQGFEFGPDRSVLDAQAAARRKAALEQAAEAEAAFKENLKSGMAFGPDRSVLDAQSAARRKAMEQQRAEAEEAFKANLRSGMAFGPDRATLDAQSAARRKLVEEQKAEAEAAFKASLKSGMAFGPDRAVLDAQLAARRKAQESSNQQGAAFGPDRSVYEAQLSARRKAEAEAEVQRLRDEERELRRRMQTTYNSAKFSAAPSYTSRGTQIAGARALVAEYGKDQAGKFLNNDSLLRSIGDLELHRKKVGEVAQSHVKLTGVMNEAHSAARGLAGSMGQMWLTWGSTVPLVAGAAIGAGMMQVVKTGKDVEYQLTFVKALTGETAVSMDELGRAISTSLSTPREAAEGLRALAQNGLNTSEALRALPQVLNLATVGEMKVGEAALGATGVMAAFNLEVTELGRVGDVFAKAAAISNTSVGGMVEAMKQASTVSDSYGVSLEETGAALSVLAKRNIEGSAAGTAFRNMMTELASPTKKARDSMKLLGIEVYDANNQLKPLGGILENLRTALAGLNQEGKLNALRALFDERGAKSANALLSDFELLKENLRTLKEESSGFTTSVAAQLQETLDGKLKGTLADFQRVTATVFFESSDGLKNLADSLRSFVNSDEFKRGLEAIANGFVNLTKLIAENGTTIVAVAAGWAALRTAMAIGPLILTTARALMALNTSLVALQVGTVALAPLLAGVAAVAALLAAAYFNLAGKTDEAREANEQYMRSLDRQGDTLEQRLRSIREENDVLERKNQLLLEGKSLREATEIAEQGRRVQTDELRAPRQVIAEARARIATRTVRLARMDREGDPLSTVGKQLRDKLEEQNKQDQETIRRTEEDMTAKAKRIKDLQADIRQADDDLRAKTERERLIKRVKEYNAAADLANQKGKYKLETLPLATAGTMDNDSLKAKMDELDRVKNKTLATFTAPERTHDTFNQRVSDELKSIRDEQAELKESSAFWTSYYRAKYNTELYGPEVSEATQRITAEREITQVLAQQVTQKARLQALRSQAGGDAEKNRHLDAEIQGLEASNKLLTIKLGHTKELARLEAQNKRDKSDAAFSKSMADFESDVRKQMEATNRSYDTKVMRPEDAAAEKASAAVREAARSRELDLQTRLSQLEEGRNRLSSEREEIERRAAEASGSQRIDAIMEELQLMDAQTSAADAELERLRAQLTTLRQITAERASQAGSNARSQDVRSQSAEYGLEKWWENYKGGAENAAKQVESIMSSSMTSLNNMVSTFATTGKLHFKDFARGVLMEITKMMASRAIVQFVAMLGGSLGGGAFGGGTSLNGSAGAGFGSSTAMPTTFAANGHVMTSEGPLPLRTYARGGIARTPQLAVYGEGRLPEAYVPLPDGRTIPVTMSGEGGGGGTPQVNMTVNVMSDGKSSVQNDASGEKAGELGRMLDQAVTAVIARERRPGGLLYA